jgi:PIN domain nuclease of toxin-antitoxin system
VSVITFWEISLKTGLGKLRFEGVTPEDYPSLAAQSGWVIHPVEASVAASFDQLPPVPEHRDPFDRLLIWTAIREGFTLVTADRTFAGYAPHGLRICW